MQKINSPYIWAALSALALSFSYPKWDWFFLAYLAILFQLITIHLCTNKKQILLIAFLSPQIANFTAFSWITYVLQEVGQLHWSVASLLHLLFGFICLPTYSAFFLCSYLLLPLSRRISLHFQAFYWALLWMSLEFIFRPFKVFPESLGSSQLPWLSFSQVASIGGVELISFLIVFVSASFFFYYKNKKISYVLGALIVFFLLHLWGDKRIEHIRALEKDKISFAIVQSNIGNTDKFLARKGNREGLRSIVDTYLRLSTEAAKEKPRLILWPETAYPMTFPASTKHLASRFSQGEVLKLFRHMKKYNYSLLFGSYEHVDGLRYNSVLLLNEKTSLEGIYRKYHLLLFGEYMPLSNIWPSLKKLNPILGDFSSGPGPKPLLWKDGDNSISLGVHICYEALVAPYMHGLAKNGADVFLNFTNDSWFGPTSEPHQHLALSIFRSIENGLPLLRATNTGISALVDANGEVLEKGPLFQETVISGKLPIYRTKIKTFYQSYAPFFPGLVIGIFLLIHGLMLYHHYPYFFQKLKQRKK